MPTATKDMKCITTEQPQTTLAISEKSSSFEIAETSELKPSTGADLPSSTAVLLGSTIRSQSVILTTQQTTPEALTATSSDTADSFFDKLGNVAAISTVAGVVLGGGVVASLGYLLSEAKSGNLKMCVK